MKIKKLTSPKNIGDRTHISESLIKSNKLFTTVLIAAVSLLMIAAVITQFTQEDAFIYFRTAQNIAESGDYSFNKGEGYPAATSFVYAYILAGVFYTFGEFSLFAVQVLNCIFAVSSALLLGKLATVFLNSNENFNKLVFWIVGTSPPLMTLAVSGMETSFLVFALSILLYSAACNRAMLLFLASAALPLLRIEVSIAPFLLILLGVTLRQYNNSILSAAGLSFGIFCFAMGNLILTGEILPQTIMAKSISYAPSHSLIDISSRAVEILFQSNHLIGMNARYIPGYFQILVGTLLLITVLYNIHQILRKSHNKLNELTNADVSVVLVNLLILCFVIGYSIGGVVFIWYLWPSSVLFYFAFSLAIERSSVFSGKSHWLVPIAAIFTFSNLIVLANNGYRETSYRSEIGRQIADEATPGDTLFLEQSGYIPFFAKIKTWDTVGLVSPEIFQFRRSDNADWWIDFVRQKEPTWIVEISPIHVSGNPDNTGQHGFTQADRDEFSNKYELIRHYVYDEHRLSNKSILSGFYSLGGAADYYIYRLKD